MAQSDRIKSKNPHWVPLTGRRILDVRRDRAISRYMAGRLRCERPQEVISANSLDEALDELGNSSQRFDVVIASCGPDEYESSAELIKILRQHRADLVVVAACMYDVRKSEEARQFAPSLAGCAGLCNAPFGPPALSWLLASALQDGWTVRRILEECVAPSLLAQHDAMAIYGVPPGSPFSAPLD